MDKQIRVGTITITISSASSAFSQAFPPTEFPSFPVPSSDTSLPTRALSSAGVLPATARAVALVSSSASSFRADVCRHVRTPACL
jgi:hypothetical protein